MNHLKRTVSIALALLLLCAVPTLRPAAKGESVKTYRITAAPGSLPSAVGADEAVNWDGAYEAVLQMYLTCSRFADLSAFGIPDTPANQNRLYLIYWAVQGVFDDDSVLLIDAENGLLTRVEYYPNDTPNYSRQHQNYNASAKAADSLLFGIAGNDALSDADKCLLVHDRLAVWYAYNYADYLNGTLDYANFEAYGVLANQLGVCNGTAQAYQWLLYQLGITCAFIESHRISHAWNEVTLDGEGYFVDVTWDDPVWDIPGQVTHNNFLQSFETFSASHGTTDFDQSPCSTLYEDYFSTAAESEIVLIGDTMYYLADNAKLYSRAPDGTTTMIRQMENSVTTQEGNVIMTVVPGGRKILAIGDDILYLAPKNVQAYNVKTGELRVVYTPPERLLPDDSYYLYGLRQRDGRVYVTANDSPEFDNTTVKRHTASFVFCDHPTTVSCRTATHPASCRTASDESTICPACRKVFQSTETDPDHHLLTRTVDGKAADCYTEGYTAGEQCTACKVFVSGHETLPITHQPTLLNVREATCTEGGYSGDEVCAICETPLAAGHETEPLGHTAPDKNGNCARCGAHLADPVPVCRWCGGDHTGGFIQKIIGFFHNILASLFGAKY